MITTQTDLEYHGIPIHMLTHGGVMWFVARDVAQALGLAWSGTARLAKQARISSSSMSFTMVQANGKSRMVVVGVRGLSLGLSKARLGAAGDSFLEWIRNSVLHTAKPAMPVLEVPAQVHQLNTLASSSMVSINDTDRTLYTTSLVIAHGVGSDHASVIKLVRKYAKQLEKFGMVGFEIQPKTEGQRGGSDTKYAVLNEPQATSILALMSNSNPVVEFKFRLVDAFYRMKDQLQPKTSGLNTRQAGVVTPAPKAGFTAMAIHQANMNDMLAKGQKLLAEELNALRQSHEDLEARVASMAALLEGPDPDTDEVGR